MNIVRRSQGGLWDPIGELDRIRREIDDLFDPSTSRFFSSDRGLFEREVSPALDIEEREDDFLVTVDLPGVDEKDLDVSVANNVLTLKGEKTGSQESKTGKVYRKETWEGSFQRTVSLPRGVDPTSISASMIDGVLRVTLPKREEAKPRQVAVKVK
jgi:HSP20 family protein